MKLFIGCIALLLPLVASAQNFGNIDPATAAILIQQVEKAKVCMDKADQTELAALQAEAEAKRDEVLAMCDAGKRDVAQAETITYAEQSMKKPIVKEFQACMGIAGVTIPMLAMMQLQNPETTGTHVCDLEIPL
jgi:N-methylhydantoinase B/oxoprolinase/acetone carboxylase alpha subunit